jgi:flagellar biosynthesis protein FlhB
MADGLERTERATPRRREEARRKGQVAVSPEVSPVAVLLAAVTVASWGAPRLLARSAGVLRTWLGAVGPTGAHDDPIWPLASHALVQLSTPLVPFFLATAAVGSAAVLAQVGWGFHPSLLAPDLGRLGPARAMSRLFSTTGLVTLVKAILKIAVVLGLAWSVLRRVGSEAVATPDMPLDALLAFVASGLRRLLLTMAAALGVLGAADYFWQRRHHEEQLRMTRQEVKEEQKESEGDPQIRGRVRRAQREISRRRMLAEIPRADVVLTNPVHVAVALRYRTGEMDAPRVLAKGAGEMAQKIKDAARQAGVPIVERRALARALFRSVQLGAEIPPALYRAVAEILAYVYSLRGRPAEGVR